jgi:hypothetical protein
VLEIGYLFGAERLLGVFVCVVVLFLLFSELYTYILSALVFSGAVIRYFDIFACSANVSGRVIVWCHFTYHEINLSKIGF